MNSNKIELIIQDYVVEIIYGKTWVKDKIYIYDPCLTLSTTTELIILDYLYQEGFIQDRRIKYEIIRCEY